MAASTNGRAPRGRPARPSTPSLPPITVAKLEETGYLLERLVDERQQAFIDKGQAYRDLHRDGTSRPLHTDEAVQLAVAMADGGDHRVALAEQLQASTLRAYDEPAQSEMLLAGGLGTAPAIVQATRRIVALVEMPLDEFEAACEGERLPEAIDERAGELRRLELSVARRRAGVAMAHYATAAGVDLGEVRRLPIKAIWQAITQALEHLDGGSRLSQLIDSAALTEDSTPVTSSTGSPGDEQPS